MQSTQSLFDMLATRGVTNLYPETKPHGIGVSASLELRSSAGPCVRPAPTVPGPGPAGCQHTF